MELDWSSIWCLPVSPEKCESSFFSMDPNQASQSRSLFLTHHSSSTLS